MESVIVFAGTTEGRILSEYLSSHQIHVIVCVATEYGETLLQENSWIKVHSGRMDREQMEQFLLVKSPKLVVDATHPYAVEVSKNLVQACQSAKIEYLRLIRDSNSFVDKSETVFVDSVDEAVEYLKQTKGNILATTGSKELAKYTAIPNYKERVFARVLSTASVADSCEKLGFCGRNLICMQGPFCEELNLAMLKQFDCKYLVTKEAGKAGGFDEKIRAAKRAGAKVVLIGRPKEQQGYSYKEVVEILSERLSIPVFVPFEDSEDFKDFEEGKEEQKNKAKRCVTLIGIGMGNPKGMTVEAREAIEGADVLIGAKRMLQVADCPQKPVFSSYDAEKIAAYIDAHSEYQKTAIILSGDIGFYSGAKRLYDALEKGNYQIEALCGISSVVYFCGKLHMAWEDVCLKSIHGRQSNLVGAVRTHQKTFTLLSAADSVKKLCCELQEYGLSDVKIYIGERLGYEDEKISCGIPEEMAKESYDGLCVALIENPKFCDGVSSCLEDELFLRGKAPMTKSEVRALSVAKLHLPKTAVVYDVGAGTGSVTVELALQAVDGMVYAIERNQEACELIEQNKRKFGTPNIEVIQGLAPETMEELPKPTHAFIGGSSGNLREILLCLLKKNPTIRLVINAVTLETIGEVTKCLKELPLVEEEILSIEVARAKTIGNGNYHLMMGQNPIYLFVGRGDGTK